MDYRFRMNFQTTPVQTFSEGFINCEVGLLECWMHNIPEGLWGRESTVQSSHSSSEGSLDHCLPAPWLHVIVNQGFPLQHFDLDLFFPVEGLTYVRKKSHTSEPLAYYWSNDCCLFYRRGRSHVLFIGHISGFHKATWKCCIFIIVLMKTDVYFVCKLVADVLGLVSGALFIKEKKRKKHCDRSGTAQKKNNN